MSLDEYLDEYKVKEKFINQLNVLLRDSDERYKFLETDPMYYYNNGDLEYVHFNGTRYNVTGDSLTAMLGDIFG
jgi:hypothetical protein